jgi:hypothetical protein
VLASSVRAMGDERDPHPWRLILTELYVIRQKTVDLRPNRGRKVTEPHATRQKPVEHPNRRQRTFFARVDKMVSIVEFAIEEREQSWWHRLSIPCLHLADRLLSMTPFVQLANLLESALLQCSEVVEQSWAYRLFVSCLPLTGRSVGSSFDEAPPRAGSNAIPASAVETPLTNQARPHRRFEHSCPKGTSHRRPSRYRLHQLHRAKKEEQQQHDQRAQDLEDALRTPPVAGWPSGLLNIMARLEGWHVSSTPGEMPILSFHASCGTVTAHVSIERGTPIVRYEPQTSSAQPVPRPETWTTWSSLNWLSTLEFQLQGPGGDVDSAEPDASAQMEAVVDLTEPPPMETAPSTVPGTTIAPSSQITLSPLRGGSRVHVEEEECIMEEDQGFYHCIGADDINNLQSLPSAPVSTGSLAGVATAPCSAANMSSVASEQLEATTMCPANSALPARQSHPGFTECGDERTHVMNDAPGFGETNVHQGVESFQFWDEPTAPPRVASRAHSNAELGLVKSRSSRCSIHPGCPENFSDNEDIVVDERSIIHRRHVDGGPIQKPTQEPEDTVQVADDELPDGSLAAHEVVSVSINEVQELARTRSALAVIADYLANSGSPAAGLFGGSEARNFGGILAFQASLQQQGALLDTAVIGGGKTKGTVYGEAELAIIRTVELSAVPPDPRGDPRWSAQLAIIAQRLAEEGHKQRTVGALHNHYRTEWFAHYRKTNRRWSQSETRALVESLQRLDFPYFPS